jgi:hypothetical protein
MGEGNWSIRAGLASFPAEQLHKNADNIIESKIIFFVEITICRPYLSLGYNTHKRLKYKSKKLFSYLFFPRESASICSSYREELLFESSVHLALSDFSE